MCSHDAPFSLNHSRDRRQSKVSSTKVSWRLGICRSLEFSYLSSVGVHLVGDSEYGDGGHETCHQREGHRDEGSILVTQQVLFLSPLTTAWKNGNVSITNTSVRSLT